MRRLRVGELIRCRETDSLYEIVEIGRKFVEVRLSNGGRIPSQPSNLIGRGLAFWLCFARDYG